MGLGPRQAKTPTYSTGLFFGIDIRLLFAYADLVMNLQSKPQPVLNCKGCWGAIPIGIVPTARIIRTCPFAVNVDGTSLMRYTKDTPRWDPGRSRWAASGICDVRSRCSHPETQPCADLLGCVRDRWNSLSEGGSGSCPRENDDPGN